MEQWSITTAAAVTFGGALVLVVASAAVDWALGRLDRRTRLARARARVRARRQG